MYGGKDYTKVQLNSATGATMQAGSTFKPFGLIAALEQGISTHTTFPGYSPQTFPEFGTGKDGEIRNFADEQFGNIDLQTAHGALGQHRLRPAQHRGRRRQDARRRRSRPACRPAPPGLEDNLSNIFGTANPHVIDMANAYATIAAKGMRATPYLVKKVTSADGIGELQGPEADQGRLRPGRGHRRHRGDDPRRHRGHRPRARWRSAGPAAGKTGTTTENKAVWFDGFTPQLAAAVGIYNDVNGKPEPMQNIAGFGELTGGTFPVKIWTAFMSGALEGTKTVDFPSRTGVGDNQVPTTTTAPSTTSESSTTSSTHDQLEQHDDVDQPDQLQQQHDVQQPDVVRPQLRGQLVGGQPGRSSTSPRRTARTPGPGTPRRARGRGRRGQRLLGRGAVLVGEVSSPAAAPRPRRHPHRLAPDEADHESDQDDQHDEQHHGGGGGQRGGVQGLLPAAAATGRPASRGSG